MRLILIPQKRERKGHCMISSEQQKIIDEHPCFSNTPTPYGRIHLPVAAGCNIQCNYCDHKVDQCLHECRPGLTYKIYTPSEALNHLKKQIEKYPSIKIIGIAGPGEPLFSEATFETIEMVRKEIDDARICLSTNGLLLHEKIDDLLRLGVKTITVTINTLSVETGRKIYASINGDSSRNAVKYFLEAQLKGLRAAVKADFIVKVNSVVIPGMNEYEIPKIARAVADEGAAVQNIIPVVPNANLSHIEPPSDSLIRILQEECAKCMGQFLKCQRCRADVVVPGVKGC